MKRWIHILPLVLLAAGSRSAGQVVVCPTVCSQGELLAAKEVRRYIYLRTGQVLPLQKSTTLPAGGNLILVANDDNPMISGLRDLIDHTTSKGGFLIKSIRTTDRDLLVIAGHDAAATLVAAYRYAEHLGVGFDLAGDAIPDEKVAFRLSGLDEVGEPRFETRGILPFHDFYQGPDLWSTPDYQAIISQLPKLGMNFIGLHTYPTWSTTGDKDNHIRQGPEPTVWIGLQQDINADGTVNWSYPAYYAHTKRPHRIWGTATRDTDQFHCGAGRIFDRNDWGADVLRSGMPTDVASCNAVFNRTGEMLRQAFRHARTLGVKTCLGTELPLGLEPRGEDVDYDWVRVMPPQLQQRLATMGLDPREPAVVRDIYKGIFERIAKTHDLDYYWLWIWEVWQFTDATRAQRQAFKQDIRCAQEALAALGNPFQLALAGWMLGSGDDPAEFDHLLPPAVPFYSLWDEADGFEDLKSSRIKWPATWLEEDWGLGQPQLECHRIYSDIKAAWSKNCHGLIAKHWRTRVLSASTAAMKDLLWVYGPTGSPVSKSMPPRKHDWIDKVYLDWATRQFGPHAAPSIAEIFATLDKGGDPGRPGAVPSIMEWEDDDVEHTSNAAPGAISANDKSWSREKDRYAFVDRLAALRPRIVGAGNRERFDYWLKTMQSFRLMAEYGTVRHRYERAISSSHWTEALARRRRMARLFEQFMTLQLEKTTNASDMGEIINLEILNWYMLVMLKTDARLSAGLGEPIPADANPSMNYTGSAFIRVTNGRPQVAAGESLSLRAILMGDATSATLHYRPLGDGVYQSIPLTHAARGVYTVTIPPQSDDFEYYLTTHTPATKIVYPVTAPRINHTVIVLP